MLSRGVFFIHNVSNTVMPKVEQSLPVGGGPTTDGQKNKKDHIKINK